jgi:hypothetical protein
MFCLPFAIYSKSESNYAVKICNFNVITGRGWRYRIRGIGYFL